MSVGPSSSGIFRRIGRAETVLLIPVSLPPGPLRAPRRHYVVRRAVPRHVTVLYPFVPPALLDRDVVRAIEGVIQGHSAVNYRLTSAAAFPNGTRYLTIEPPESLVRLIGDFQRVWPQYPRYGGEFRSIVPHVTTAEARHAHRKGPDLTPYLPVEVAARYVEIWRYDLIGGWRMYSRSELPPAH